MSRLSVPDLEYAAGPSGQIYAQIKKAIGSVPKTFAAIAAHGPAALKSILAADAVLAALMIASTVSPSLTMHSTGTSADGRTPNSSRRVAQGFRIAEASAAERTCTIKSGRLKVSASE